MTVAGPWSTPAICIAIWDKIAEKGLLVTRKVAVTKDCPPPISNTTSLRHSG